jgi:SAM-dependent methyltransferase
MKQLRYLLRRRKYISSRLDVQTDFEDWEETCVPSYVHRNILAAYVSWQRLFEAKKLAFDLASPTKVLDFGSGIAEFKKLLPTGVRYFYIEEEDSAAQWIEEEYPDAVRITLENPQETDFEAIFALDSLEHNDNYEELIDRLAALLAENGVLVICGPTENFLYRFGRRMAGFSGHYHQTTIHQINHHVDGKMTLLKRKRLPYGLSLFVLSCWKRTR